MNSYTYKYIYNIFFVLIKKNMSRKGGSKTKIEGNFLASRCQRSPPFPCIQTVRVQIRYDRACCKTVRVGDFTQNKRLQYQKISTIRWLGANRPVAGAQAPNPAGSEANWAYRHCGLRASNPSLRLSAAR